MKVVIENKKVASNTIKMGDFFTTSNGSHNLILAKVSYGSYSLITLDADGEYYESYTANKSFEDIVVAINHMISRGELVRHPKDLVEANLTITYK